MDKEQLRKAMKAKLKCIPIEIYKQKCLFIYRRLYRESVWKNANTIGITLSINQEVETREIIKRAWELKKSVAVPKANPISHELTFYAIQSFEQLEKGHFGIMEPKVESAAVVDNDEIDLLFVPGLVFDRNGYRIGYGGGYYDRYLAQFKQKTISLAFACQIVDKIQRFDYDKPVNCIITENETIYCN